MRTYTIKGQEHIVYDLESELPDEIVINPDWKNARDGDWVRADDGAYIQVLKRKKLGKTGVIQTCVGTYSVTGSMDTSEREDRYTLSGKSSATIHKERTKPTRKEAEFAYKVVNGSGAVEAYMEAFSANSVNYAKKRAALLLKTERISTLMNPSMEELEKVFAELDVDLRYLIKGAKDQIDEGKNGSDKISALKMLWEAYGVVEKKKITEIAGIFQGFDQKRLEDAKRPELVEHQSPGDEVA